MTNRGIAAWAGGTTLPALLLVGLAALVAVQFDLVPLPHFAPAMAGPPTTTVTPRPFDYRAGGEFIRDGAVVDGPLVHVERPAALEIMVYQVSAADYGLCVADGACHKPESRRKAEGDVAVTGVSFDDAGDYARWLSRKTGQTWRLPTLEEWVFAAGSKAADTALGPEGDAADPSRRWLLAYEREATFGRDGPANPAPLGSLGQNEYGLADLSGVVWEWTATCTGRTTLDGQDAVLALVENCGAHILEGRHRTATSNFIRDAIAGGCSVGTPPDNLGFRLVREPTWWERAAQAMRSLVPLGGARAPCRSGAAKTKSAPRRTRLIWCCRSLLTARPRFLNY